MFKNSLTEKEKEKNFIKCGKWRWTSRQSREKIYNEKKMMLFLVLSQFTKVEAVETLFFVISGEHIFLIKLKVLSMKNVYRIFFQELKFCKHYRKIQMLLNQSDI